MSYEGFDINGYDFHVLLAVCNFWSTVGHIRHVNSITGNGIISYLHYFIKLRCEKPLMYFSWIYTQIHPFLYQTTVSSKIAIMDYIIFSMLFWCSNPWIGFLQSTPVTFLKLVIKNYSKWLLRYENLGLEKSHLSHQYVS